MKKAISVIIVIGILLSMLCVTSFADNTLPESGTLCENINYTFDQTTGVLTLSGTGEIDPPRYVVWDDISGIGGLVYPSFSNHPEIKKVVFSDGYLYITPTLLSGCKNLDTLILPKSLKTIEENAFLDSNIKYVYYAGSASNWKAVKIEKDCIRYNVIDDDGVWGDLFNDRYQLNTIYKTILHFNYNSAVSHRYGAAKQVSATGNHVGYTGYRCICGEIAKTDFKAPTGVRVNLRYTARSEHAVKLTWNPVPGVDGYQLSFFKGGLEKTINVKTNSYLLKSLSPATCYSFTIRFYKKADNGLNYSSRWSKSLCVPTLPHKSYVQKFIPAKNTIGAIWKQVDGVTGYQLQVGKKANFSDARTYTFTGAKTLKYTFKKLTPKTGYYFRIRTFKFMDESYHFSLWSRTYKVKTK